MTRAAFAVLGAALGALIAGVWVVCAGLGDVDPVSRGMAAAYMGAGALTGFVLFTMAGSRLPPS